MLNHFPEIKEEDFALNSKYANINWYFARVRKKEDYGKSA